ncbi:Tuberous sclerosis 1 protein-like protein [Colletotrichum trifolii]|uniref:Tuberous sclerosis 1 protein-like protein n=1 Tax=Colletotrichum trifolii TaxID=5466 RepID=A0A4R8RRP1_COLTR|nr:Tuberous sclerosis 1 protein-like protein [Colletotrichum trifolii]
MASSASRKDLSKALTAFLSSSPSLPLPDDIREIIDAYLNKHEKYDDSSSDRLQEELFTIYDKLVKGTPSKYAVFLHIFALLVPVLRTPARLFRWWDALNDPVLSNFTREKGLVEESHNATLKVLRLGAPDDSESAAEPTVNPFAKRVLTAWLEKYYRAQAEGDLVAETSERAIRQVLIAYGKKKPKDFLLTLDTAFVRSEYRARTAKLLCEFVQSQPPHLHQILQTPLFGNLLRCLQQDTSTTVISVATTALIMILPHMPSSLVPHLPNLFNIYARLLFWDSERNGIIEAKSDESEQHKSATASSGWEACSYSPDTDDVDVPHLDNYFTILYGLYPINFMDYIRKPQRYLRHANAANPDEVEVQPTEIRHKSERFRQSHLLHPNFYTLTIDSEKTDFGRWMTSEPAEVVAECIALRLSTDTIAAANTDAVEIEGDASMVSDDSDHDGLGPPLLSGSAPEPGAESWRTAQSPEQISRASSRVQPAQCQGSLSSQPSNRNSLEAPKIEVLGDSPTLPPQLNPSTSHTHLQDMIHSNKVIKSGLQQSQANDSVPSLSLSHQESTAEKTSSHMPPPLPTIPAAPSPADGSSQIAHLQRQILLLHNDLSFERYLKQQHMAHIGELRRRQVREAASEAELQNLILSNRTLKKRLEESKKAEMQARKDCDKRVTMVTKRESDLSVKSRALREEFKKTKLEVQALQQELQTVREESEKLKKLVCDMEVKELNSTQNMQSIELSAADVDRLKAEVERLSISERNLQAREAEREAVAISAVEAENKANVLEMKLKAREEELQKTRKLFQTQIGVLNAKLVEAHEGIHSRRTAETKAAVESALATSRAKQAELQKQYTTLMRKHTVLQSQMEETKFTVGSSHSHGRGEFVFRMDGDGDSSMHSTSPVTTRGRGSGIHRVLSESDFLDPSFNMTPPLMSKPSTPVPPSSHLSQAASSPMEAEDGTSSSATDPRYFGRGGVQNRRKDEKGKKAEGDKKKSGVVRGIRGYV